MGKVKRNDPKKKVSKKFQKIRDYTDSVPKNTKEVIDSSDSSNESLEIKKSSKKIQKIEDYTDSVPTNTNKVIDSSDSSNESEEDLLFSQLSTPKKILPVTKKAPCKPKPQQLEHKQLSFKMLLITLAGIIFGLHFWYTTSPIIEVPPIEPVKINVSHEISLLPELFPKQQADTWKRLSIGIRNIQTLTEPAVFFMVQWNEETRGQKRTSNIALGIAEAAGMIAAKYLGNINQTASPIILSEDDMKLSHHGLLVSQYKNDLESRHVMIIEKIEKVNGHIAQGLRYICDEHNPLVNRSAIFLILNADSCPGISKNDIVEGSTRSIIALSEKCLTNLWGEKNGLEPDILMPLLARIINSVIKIMPEAKHDEA